jgi:hypothetical protein
VFSQFTWLIDLSFEEGILKIGVSVFTGCSNSVRQISFAVGSQLQYIRTGTLSDSPLNKVVGRARIVEIDPSAFIDKVWREFVRFEDLLLFFIDDRFIPSVASRVITRFVSSSPQALVEANIEMILIYIVSDHRDSTICYNSCGKFV